VFIPAEKLDVTQISLTGVRSLALMGLLIVAPRSFKEIKEKFIEMKILEKESSDDVLRIDLNTIKTMGCDVARPCASNGYKYIAYPKRTTKFAYTCYFVRCNKRYDIK